MINIKLYTISLCMIVKNEAKNLSKCLESVQDCVDEIIIVDTGSTDNTKEIARTFGAKIFDFKWDNDFSKARNFSIEKANGDYILILDADEYIEKKIDFSYVLSEKKDVYFVKVKSYFDDTSSLINPSIRLFKNNIGLMYKRKIHEHLNVEDFNDLTYGETSIVINHIGYKQNEIKFKDKRIRNINLLLEEIKERPDSYNYYNLGNEYLAQKKWEKAYECFIKSYNIMDNNSYFLRSIYNIAFCLKNMAKYQEAFDILDNAIKTYPDYTDLYFLKGLIYEELGYIEDAIIYFRSCIELGDVKNLNYISNQGVGTFLSRYKLGLMYEVLGNTEKSLEEYYLSLINNKNYFPSLYNLIKLLTKMPLDNSVIMEFINKIYSINNNKDCLLLFKAFIKNKNPLSLELLKNSTELRHKYGHLSPILELYNNKIKESMEKILNIDFESEEVLYDVIVLSLLTESVDLKNKLNKILTKTQNNIYNAMFLGNKIRKFDINIESRKFIINIFETILVLKQFDLFEKLLMNIHDVSKTLFYDIIELMYNWGFKDVAKDLIIKQLSLSNFDKRANKLLGNYYKSKGEFDIALSYYLKYHKSDKKSYINYVNIINLYVLQNNKDMAKKFLCEMIEKFPYSIWIQHQKNKL